MREKVLEMKELREELAFAQSAVNKARKLDSGASQSEDRRGKSLDGWEFDGNVKQMRAQVRLELEVTFFLAFVSRKLLTNNSWIQHENKSFNQASVVSHLITVEQIVCALYT